MKSIFRCTTVACPKWQTSVLKGKFTFLSSLSILTNIDEIRSDDGAWKDLGACQTLSSLVEKQPRKVDLPFMTDICHLTGNSKY